jgi:hypothetical protein
MNSKKLQLEDLVYTYPDISDPYLQTTLSGKKEFFELYTDKKEKLPKNGGLLKHQQIVRRFMLFYNELLVMHRTGTGKTQSGLGSADQFVDLHIHEMLHYIINYIEPKRTHIKKIIIILKNKKLEQEFKKQLVCGFMNNKYQTIEFKTALTHESAERAADKFLSKYFEFKTHRQFGKKLSTMNTSSLKQYSDTLIIIDEAHNIAPDNNLVSLDDIETLKTKKDISRLNKILKTPYWGYHRLFHTIERSKKMLMTATPMIDIPTQISSLMNLILPLDNQMDVKLNYYKVKPEKLRSYFKGRISYVRELDTGADVEYQGESINIKYNIPDKRINSQLILSKDIMSDYQEYYYNEVAKREEIEEEEEEYDELKEEENIEENKDDVEAQRRKKKTAAHSNLIQAATLVLPDGEIGIEFLKTYITQIKGGTDLYKFKDDERGRELLARFKDKESINQLSSKIATITQECNNNSGIKFIYTDQLLYGAIPITLALENLYGYTRFRGKRSVFTHLQEGERSLFCEKSEIDVPRKINIKSEKRYAIISGNTTKHEIDTILELIRSKENMHGEYIDTLIGTEAVKLGYNLFNVVQFHALNSEWNASNNYQALSRILRTGGHDMLLEEYIKKGKNPEEARVDVKVFLHVAYTQHDLELETKKISINPEEYAKQTYDPSSLNNYSIDTHMYITAESKDIIMSRILRIMKEESVDCIMNRRRNIRETDEDYSAICDYNFCNYKCTDSDFHPDEVLTNNSYNVLYSSEIVTKIKDDIILLFKSNFYFYIDQLYNVLDYDNIYIDMALSELINNKISFLDRYGNITYLQENNGIFFLQRDFPYVKNSYLDVYYIQNLINIEYTKLDKYIERLQFPLQLKWIEQLMKIKDENEFNTIYDNINPKNKATILEQAIINLIKEGPNISQNTQRILDINENTFIEVRKPINEIKIVATDIFRIGKQGRPIDITKDKVLSSSNELVQQLKNYKGDKKNPLVFVHKLLGLEQKKQTKYNVMSNIDRAVGTLRVLEVNDNLNWKNIDSKAEKLVYQSLLINKRMKEKEEVQHDIYGKMINDEFYIVNKTKETQKAKTKLSSQSRGGLCKNIHKGDLYILLWKLKISLLDFGYTDEKLDSYKNDPTYNNKEDMLIFLKEIKPKIKLRGDEDMDELTYYYLLTRAEPKITVKSACDIIQTHMNNKNLIVE